jgi:hypothetical protein
MGSSFIRITAGGPVSLISWVVSSIVARATVVRLKKFYKHVREALAYAHLVNCLGCCTKIGIMQNLLQLVGSKG